MSETSTAEIERDEQVVSASNRRRHKAKHPVREDVDADGSDDDGGGNDGESTRRDLSPAKVREMITTLLTVSPEVAGAAYGLGRNSSYKACHLYLEHPDDNNGIQSFFAGGKLCCPTAPICRKLGIEQVPQAAPAPTLTPRPSSKRRK